MKRPSAAFYAGFFLVLWWCDAVTILWWAILLGVAVALFARLYVRFFVLLLSFSSPPSSLSPSASFLLLSFLCSLVSPCFQGSYSRIFFSGLCLLTQR